MLKNGDAPRALCMSTARAHHRRVSIDTQAVPADSPPAAASDSHHPFDSSPRAPAEHIKCRRGIAKTRSHVARPANPNFIEHRSPEGLPERLHEIDYAIPLARPKIHDKLAPRLSIASSLARYPRNRRVPNGDRGARSYIRGDVHKWIRKSRRAIGLCCPALLKTGWSW